MGGRVKEAGRVGDRRSARGGPGSPVMDGRWQVAKALGASGQGWRRCIGEMGLGQVGWGPRRSRGNGSVAPCASPRADSRPYRCVSVVAVALVGPSGLA